MSSSGTIRWYNGWWYGSNNMLLWWYPYNKFSTKITYCANQFTTKLCFIVVANSITKSEKAISAATQFNLRVVECTLASKLLAKYLQIPNWKDITTLRQVHDAVGYSLEQMEQYVLQHIIQNDYTIDDLVSLFGVDDLYSLLLVHNESNPKKQQSIQNVLQQSNVVFKLQQRAQHVYSEAGRVLQFQQLCNSTMSVSESSVSNNTNNNEVLLQQLGTLMNNSQISCRNLYECSCNELNELTSLCCTLGAYGSRLTGAGWGGCTVSLIPERIQSEFIQGLHKQYYIPRGITDDDNFNKYIFITGTPSPGASCIY